MNTVEESPSKVTTSVPRGVLAAITGTQIARAAFSILLTTFIAYQFQLQGGFAASETQGLVALAVLLGLIRPFIGFTNDAHPLGVHRRKNLMLVGNVLLIVAMGFLLTQPNPSSVPGISMIAVAFVIYGAGDAFLGVGIDSLALDVAPTTADKNRVKTMSRTGAIAGLVITYALGSFLFGVLWIWLLLALIAMILAGTVLTLHMQESPITRERAQALLLEQKVAMPVPYKVTMMIAGLLMLLSALAESLVNVQMEPFLIARYGNAATQYYITELSAAVIALGVVAGISVSRRVMKVNLGKLIVPATAVIIAFYACLPWLAPTLPIYFAWITVKGTAAMLFTLAIDRMLMDVVQGAQKGGTFQIFFWFSTGGTVIGTALGSILRAVMPFEMLLLLVAVIDGVALAIYVFLLAPRIKHDRHITKS